MDMTADLLVGMATDFSVEDALHSISTVTLSRKILLAVISSTSAGLVSIGI